MPTYSDDGQWWWDGRSWQPVGQQPTTAKKKSPTLLIVAGAAVLVLLIAVGGVFVWKNTSSGDSAAATGAPPADAKIIQPGQPVTAQALSEVHPQAFHESILKRQMTAPIGQLRSARFETPAEFSSRKSWSITDIALDHKADKFSYQQSIFGSATPTDIRCVNGKELVWSDYLKKWEPPSYERPTCTRKPFDGSGDAIASSGLSAEQADKVISYLRQAEGFVHPAQPTLLSASGKTYIRQVVDFRPITRSDGNDYGSAVAMFAFRETGNDPTTWTWGNPFNLASGIHMVYYLDPATLLPVAAFQSAIASPKAYPEQKIQVINYAFPATLPQPKLGNSPNTMSINLPEGWKVP